MFTHTKKNITELKPIVVFTGPNSRGEEQSELKNLLPALLVQLLLNSPDTVITNRLNSNYKVFSRAQARKRTIWIERTKNSNT